MKRIVSLLLAVVMMLGIFSIVATATEVERAQTGVDNVIHFDANSTGWQGFSKVFCHIWKYGGDSFFAWQSKAQRCSDDDGDGIWTYDLDAKSIYLEPGTLYGVIFSNENGMQTYNLLFGAECIGDTVYCDGSIYYESPADSSKSILSAFWKNQDKSVFGPELCITSIGNVVGICVPRTTTTYAMFVDFLVTYLDNARTYSSKDDQAIIDDIAKAIGLSIEETQKAITYSGVTVGWKSSDSTIGDELPNDPTEDTAYIRVDNDKVYEVEIGDTFEYTFNLQCDEKIASLDASTYYDSDGLEFLPKVDSYGDYTGEEFPNVYSMISNFNVDNKLVYNYTYIKGIRFPVAEDGILTDKNILFTGEFKVTGQPGEIYDIYTSVNVLGDMDNNKIVYNSVQLNEDVTVIYSSEVVGGDIVEPSDPSEAPAPTEEPTANTAYIRVDNDKVYEVEIGDTFEYTFNLQCDEKIASLDASTYYDSDGLEFLPKVDSYGDYTGEEFPNVYSMISNFNVDNKLVYNYTYIKGIRFPVAEDGILTDKNILFTGEFKVTGQPGEIYDIYTSVNVLGDVDNNKIVYNSVQVNEDVTVIYDANTNANDETLVGDVDLDGKITVLDATKIQRNLAEMEQFRKKQTVVGDVDRSGKLEITDATKIQLFVAEIIDKF